MGKELLNPWAIDADGKYVSIEHAQSGQSYFCPKCKEPLSFRRKGKGPNAHRDHFSHRPDCDCKGYTAHESESAIHKFAKDSIFAILDNAIKEHQEFPISWTCRSCKQEFQGNLLQRADSLVVEKEFGSSRPDIALLDAEGRPIVAIEVVFTHDVEDNTLQFYQDSCIVLVRVEVHSAEDCNDMVQKLSHPDSVNLCYNTKCASCQSTTINRRLIMLNNQSGHIVGLTPGFDKPFGLDPVYGLPFNDSDIKEANDFLNRNNPRLQLQLQDQPYHRALFVPKQIARPRPTYNRDPFKPTPLEKVQKAERRNAAIRKNYAIKGKSAKKSGGKRK